MTKPTWEIILASSAEALRKVTPNPNPSLYEPLRFQKKSIWALRPFIPYCLRSVNDKTFIWLNRDYKPLGIATKSYDVFVDYMQLPWLHVQANEPVAARGDFWLFDDSCPPWNSKAHANRLILLIDSILRPDLNLHDSSDQTFKLLFESDSEWRKHAPNKDRG